MIRSRLTRECQLFINQYSNTQIRCISSSRFKRPSGPNKRSSKPFPKHRFKSQPSTKGTSTTPLEPAPETSVFSFGKFSQLAPTKTAKEVSIKSVPIDKIDNFDQLRIFPTVRDVMIQEIKSQYLIKGPRRSSIEGVEIKPTPVQIATIRKLNQTRTVKKAKNVEEEEVEMKKDEETEKKEQEQEEIRTKVFTVAAETGSGKTWAYLSSILTKLKQDDFKLFQELNGEVDEYYRSKKRGERVRSMILLPTQELVEQVYQVLQRAGSYPIDYEKLNVPGNYNKFLELQENETLGLNVMKFGTGDAPKVLFDACGQYGTIDVLVTTPAKIASFENLNNFGKPYRIFKNLQYCVVDEADTLFDKSWIEDTTNIIKILPNLRDLIMVSATIPKNFQTTLNKLFPKVGKKNNLIYAVTPQLHKIPRTIKVSVLDAEQSPYHGSKSRCLAQAIYAISKDGTEPGLIKRILIFVNQKSDVQPVVQSLVEKYKFPAEDIVGIEGSIPVQQRLELLQPFLQPAEILDPENTTSNIKVLVCTDLMARGMNFVGIKNVILFDLPNSSVDLVHRLGRTGRMRQSGRAFVIVDRRTRKSWIKGLGTAVLRNMTIG
ncbi:MRH4 [[Candida] subhashii]|uniref:ATP-dependent RNA helicase n=1 Tax=[Candida] subhashii TaxID=561895 RepID=A0A8J5QDU8_9ASCO|nr:MRH4 [[Candida] subhashii]KAG7660838.1 MRH4 [[Candida] subhashii]